MTSGLVINGLLYRVEVRQIFVPTIHGSSSYSSLRQLRI